MQIISVLAFLAICLIIAMNFQNNITVNMFTNAFHVGTYAVNLAVFTVVVFILGIISAVFFLAPVYKSLKTKFEAYKRELEKGSISNSNGEAKIQVLENKISVLEKALDEAIKKKNE